MVQTPFTWRYGGRSVFLYGSFNGWTERILMILVEGSSTVFQRILDLPPGGYQYKFLVDDLWRVDEQQLCIRDSYGMINNFVFVTEQDFLPPTLSSQRLPWNGVIDATIVPAVASSSGGSLEPLPRLAENDINVLRYHLSVHLSASKAYDLMPDSGKVIALDVDVAVRQAFHVLFEEGVSVVPLWDEQGTQIMGMLTASDFILILLQLHLNSATLTDEEIETHTISAWKDVKFQQHRENVGTSEPLQRRSLVQQGGPDESLKDLALKIVQNKISTVPILNSTQDGSCPQLLCMACLAGILKYIFRHCRRHLEFLPLLQKPVGDLPLGTWAREVGSRSNRPLLTLRAGDPLSSALNLLIRADVSSVPIVDDSGTLVNVYCRSDITSLANGNLYARLRLDQTNISQALEIVDVNQNRYQTCTRFDSLFRVMELLSDPVVRRVIVIDPQSRHVEGIITLRDVFSFILS